MLNPRSFANALALTTGLVYLAFYLFGSLGSVAADAVVFVYNAQFGGANIARLIPTAMSFWFFLGNIVAAMGASWLFAYVWAWLYNNFVK